MFEGQPRGTPPPPGDGGATSAADGAQGKLNSGLTTSERKATSEGSDWDYKFLRTVRKGGMGSRFGVGTTGVQSGALEGLRYVEDGGARLGVSGDALINNASALIRTDNPPEKIFSEKT